MATLLDQLASHLVVGLAGLEPTTAERRLLESLPPAGVILFSRNVVSPDQLEALSREVSSIITRTAGLPPLVMADHEGGRVSVLSGAIGTPPTQMAVARSGDLELCRRLYRDTARRLSACGVNVMLGPVADVNTERLNPVIGTRSFGDDPARVAVLVRESVRAIRGEGIAACIKHFPGHGSTIEDSHVALPLIRRSPQELKAVDRPPFGAGIWAGVDMVMMGHIIPPGGRGPSTLESGIIVGVLREELGFDGVIITDALEMAGVRLGKGKTGRPEGGSERSRGEIVECAVTAGNDLLLFARPLGEVYDELGSGAMESCSRAIDPRSARRVEGLRRGLQEKSLPRSRDASGIPDRRIPSLYREIAAKSIDVKRDPHLLLPLKDAPPGRLLFVGERADFENDVVRRFVDTLVRRLERRGEGDKAREMDFWAQTARPAQGDFEIIQHELAGGGEKGPTVLVLLNRKPISGGTLRSIARGADVVIDTDWPHAAELIEGEESVITTFGLYEAAADELLNVCKTL